MRPAAPAGDLQSPPAVGGGEGQLEPFAGPAQPVEDAVEGSGVAGAERLLDVLGAVERADAAQFREAIGHGLDPGSAPAAIGLRPRARAGWAHPRPDPDARRLRRLPGPPHAQPEASGAVAR